MNVEINIENIFIIFQLLFIRLFRFSNNPAINNVQLINAISIANKGEIGILTIPNTK